MKKGMPVLAGSGIIGRISEVNTTNAKVALISDTGEDANRFAITIKGNKGDVNGIVILLSTFEENRALKAKIDEFAQDKVRLQTVEEENRELKKQLKLEATLTDFKTVTAVTISRSPTTWQSLSSRAVVTIIIAFIVIVGLIAGSNWWAKRTNTPPFIQRFSNDLAGGVSRVIAVPTTAIGRTANSIGNSRSNKSASLNCE
ncbi:hypothetical protein GQS40_07070|uniref:Cell shape-determining protein MreC n=1 Tax=Leuconostoc lactis TaxID=1246 RepID=A0A6L7ACC4_LEULA|nr:hypothetical protein [Leuconostoc lactis]